MARKSIKFIQNLKNIKKITCLTAYSSSIAKILDRNVDIILVGDSLGTEIYGMPNTQNVTLDMMLNHGKAVVNSTKNSFTVVDMPYKTYENKKEALLNAKKILKFTKCQSIKLETNFQTIEIVRYLKKNKINVISHIGVTPQKYKNFKQIRSVGNNETEKKKLLELAIELEKAGSSIIVLECVKEKIAREISNKLKIPTIGIGASLHCDGQILVIDDILNKEGIKKIPRFVKSYSNINKIIEKSVQNYCKDVIQKKFPKLKNTY